MFSRSCKYLLEIALGEKMPVWMTLFGILVTAGLTYMIAPYLNAQFEVNKQRSIYIMENLRSLSDKTASLFGDIQTLNQEIADGDLEIVRQIDSARNAITALQWRANEYEVIFADPRAKQMIKEYSDNLQSLDAAVSRARSLDDTKRILEAAHKVAISTKSLVSQLSQQADWSSSFKPL